jgi:putative DNA methylase
MPTRPPVLIEHWFPIDVIGAESMRERGASSALPPLYFLHVWWARRPLLTSRAAILASVLPAWSEDWPDSLRERFPDEKSYERWFVRLCGIFGDPVAGRKMIQWAKDTGAGKLSKPPYKHKRAFTVSPSKDFLDTLGDLLEHTWGKRDLKVLDPCAGGGSIPFEALRYGFETYANELNPVASVILKATLDYPFCFGPKLAKDIEKYGAILAKRVRERLEPFFPVADDESIHAYIWARTVPCPYTGKVIPLVPNWFLRQGATPVAVTPDFSVSASRPAFAVTYCSSPSQVEAAKRGTKKSSGSKVTGISPWAQNQTFDGSYIKEQAQKGELGHILFGVAAKTSRGIEFRAPTAADSEAFDLASEELASRRPDWLDKNVLSDDAIPYGYRINERDAIAQYGFQRWTDFFSPRQLLALGCSIEAYRDVAETIQKDVDPERAEAICCLLAMAIDKAADYNAVLTTWESTRQIVKHVFKRHAFEFTWSYAEFDAARNLVPWVLAQVADAYKGIATIAAPEDGSHPHAGARQMLGSAATLDLANRSVDCICVDPPYYNNVHYAELADFFYFVLKRTYGYLHPSWFRADFTERDEEAVANPARFRDAAAKKKQKALLAEADYERKMALAFAEMNRVLRDDGALTVMFTHKKVEAWDTLATSLIGAGFAIHSSWPVHTESEHSLHQAKKNAAQSTILLTCRKRAVSTEPVWWDDLKGRIRRVAREKAEEFERQGIRGVDLYIATFGPTLAILSENWPVLTSEMDERTGEPKPLRPEVALDLAREEVIDLRKRGLLLGRTVAFDSFTDWYLMAWDAFQAQEFPGDEARKLALALGLDLEKQVIAEKKLVTKKSATVLLQPPQARRKRAMVDPDLRTFPAWIDAVHTAMLLYQEDGAQACQQLLRESGLLNDTTFKALVQALINAIPRTKQKGKFVRPEAETLEAMRLTFFDDLTVPPEEEAAPTPRQGDLFDQLAAVAEEADDYGDENLDEDESDPGEEGDE